MAEQTEALRLADALDLYATGDKHQKDIEDAAAELRRLHALCGEWENKAATWLASPEAARRLDGYRELAQRLNAAESVNAQLLEALHSISLASQDSGSTREGMGLYARAAIAAAKGVA
jgi:hypothetical protein